MRMFLFDFLRFSLEMHLVHYKLSYGTITAAKEESDGLGVLGILFDADHSNHDYDALEVIKAQLPHALKHSFSLLYHALKVFAQLL